MKLYYYLPNTWEEPAKQKGAVALDEGGEEGEDTVDGETDEERLPTAYPVSQSSPEKSSNHHPKIYNQACGQSKGDKNITSVNTKCQFLLKQTMVYSFITDLFVVLQQNSFVWFIK